MRRGPADVWGRRLGALVIDLALVGLLSAPVVATSSAEYSFRTEADAIAFCDNFGGEASCVSEGKHARFIVDVESVAEARLECLNSMDVPAFRDYEDNWEDVRCQVDDDGTARLIDEGEASNNAILWCVAVSVAVLVAVPAVFGRSLGKLVLGLRVVKTDGSPLRWSDHVVRGLLLVLDGGCFIVGLVVSLNSEQRMRVGDLAANTTVVGAATAGPIPLFAPVESASGRPPPPSATTAPTADVQWDDRYGTYVTRRPGTTEWYRWNDEHGRWVPIN